MMQTTVLRSKWILLLVAVLVVVGGSGAAPFLYPLF